MILTFLFTLEKDAQEHATRLKRVQESPTAVNENADPEILTIGKLYLRIKFWKGNLHLY